MRFLFYIVHPSKYHLFRHTINELNKNHTVDLIINTKDVLEELVKNEGWEYTNIFPKGRNVSFKPSIIKSGLKFILTLIRLEHFLLLRKKYDVFITDDALVVNGWFRRLPSFIFNDNDIDTIKINKILFYFAYRIISPSSTNLGPFSKKKISFKGNKALAHLHPKYYKPLTDVLQKYGLTENRYGMIRLSKINATHDIGNTGISNSDLEKILDICIKQGDIIISSERVLDEKYKKYTFKGNPNDIFHLIYYSNFLICDSATMASEAAILGTPNVLINKVGKKCSVNRDLFENELQYYFDNFNESISAIEEISVNSKLKDNLREKTKIYIDQCDDLNKFIINVLENYN